MSWTDERIELLQKLWLQGMSASKIANELAHGLTRNAVIGKVYRLGLSGRTKADGSVDAQQAQGSMTRAASERPAPQGTSHRATHSSIHAGPQGMATGVAAAARRHSAEGHAPRAARGSASYAASISSAQAAQNASFIQGNTALAVTPLSFTAPQPTEKREVVVPIAEPVTILELRDSMCRWPIGDPTQPDFRFCGARKTPGAGPYCACHSAIAYQPQHDRRRSKSG